MINRLSAAVVRFFDKSAYQPHRARQADGERGTYLFADGQTLLPFQIKTPSDYGSVNRFELYDEDDVLLVSLSISAITKTCISDGTYRYTFPGSSVASLNCGQKFYIFIRTTIGTHYSELMDVIDVGFSETETPISEDTI